MRRRCSISPCSSTRRVGETRDQYEWHSCNKLEWWGGLWAPLFSVVDWCWVKQVLRCSLCSRLHRHSPSLDKKLVRHGHHSGGTNGCGQVYAAQVGCFLYHSSNRSSSNIDQVVSVRPDIGLAIKFEAIVVGRSALS